MSLFRSALTVSGLTFLSRISGLARDVVIAKTFGASGLTDAFWVAFRIPNLLRRLFAEGAFAQSFVPILAQTKQQEGDESAKKLINQVALILFLTVTFITLIGIIVAPWLITLLASGIEFSPEPNSPYQSALWMTRVMFPYIICMSITALSASTLNTWGKFAIPAFTPILLNLCMIGACFWLIQYVATPIHALAIGVMIGGVAQVSTIWIALARQGLVAKPGSIIQAWRNPHTQRIIHIMGPAILGVSVAQISILINTNIATWLAPGSVTWLSFSDRLMEFPTALLGVAFGTVLLPSLSASFAANDQQKYSQLLDWGMRLIMLFGIPCTIGLTLLAEGLVATLFNYGQFSAFDVSQTKYSVIAYSIGLMGILSVKILAPGFYAKQDIKTPVKVAIGILILTQLMNLVFVPIFSHAGLTLSVGLGSSFNALFLWLIMLRKNIYQIQAGWLKFFTKVIPAAMLLAIWLWFANQHINWVELDHNSWNGQLNQALENIGIPAGFVVSRVLCLIVVMLGSVLIYFSALAACGFKLKALLRKPNK